MGSSGATATVTMLEAAIEEAAAAGALDVADTLTRMLPYMLESAAAWTTFREDVGQARDSALRLWMDSPPDGPSHAVAWEILQGLTNACWRLKEHAEIARAVHMTARELDSL